MLVDETFYVLGGRTLSGNFSDKIECYRTMKNNEWNEKEIPVRTGNTRERENG